MEGRFRGPRLTEQRSWGAGGLIHKLETPSRGETVSINMLSSFLMATALIGVPQKFVYKSNPRRLYQLQDLSRVEIGIGKGKVKAWVMDTDSKRQEGMMFLKPGDVQPNDAMIFVFPDSAERSFWMHNTLQPLDIAYISQAKKIVRATTMKALDESGTPSNGAAMYVVEMPAGAFKRLGVKAGQSVKIPPTVKAAD